MISRSSKRLINLGEETLPKSSCGQGLRLGLRSSRFSSPTTIEVVLSTGKTEKIIFSALDKTIESPRTSPPSAKANAGFLNRVKTGRPHFTLKTATTADGKIATKSQLSQWITGDEARRYGHLLRTINDAVLVGSGTALKDDPELTCRLPGLSYDRRPRIVIDGRLRIPLTSKLVRSAAQTPLWIVTLSSHSKDQTSPYEAHGTTVIRVKADESGHPGIQEWTAELGRRGITRILVEGGSAMAGSLLAANLLDRIAWFRAPKLMGDDGIAAISALGTDRIEDLPQFRTILSKPLGQDRLDILERTS